MDCKTTSIKPRRRAAFTLVEALMSIGIGSLVMLAVCCFTLYTAKAFSGMSNYVDLEQKSQKAIDILTRDIRQVNQLLSNTTNTLVFEDSDGVNLSFSYDPTARTLTRSKAGANDVLLRECDFLSFGIFQRTPINGTYDQYPTAVPATCKLVQVSWICSRKILGSVVNTESVQTAKIIIRKE